jgi:hypothetical protein
MSDFSKSWDLTTGVTAKASSVNPLADLSPETLQDDNIIPAVVAPIPVMKFLRVK